MNIVTILSQFIGFTLVDGFICYLFFTRIRRYKKIKPIEFFVMCIGNYFIWLFLPPVLRQIANVVWMTLVLTYTKQFKFFYCLKSALCAMCYVLVFEMLYSMILEYCGITVILDLDVLSELFISLLPIKIIEILLILCWKGGNKMSKLWAGTVVRK